MGKNRKNKNTNGTNDVTKQQINKNKDGVHGEGINVVIINKNEVTIPKYLHTAYHNYHCII